jgi:2-polyprenyl-3-methyl-5-hydroxy-6-metoxy-1,4-benzoquinol methylase
VKDYASINRKWWNDVTAVHAKSDLYNLASFKKGKSSLQPVEKEELLPYVRGKTFLHLLCHFGMDTLSFARKGAIVTGVDLSDKSIRLAKKLAREQKIPAKFICSDVYDLPKVLDEKYDFVFASYGVLCWLSNIKKFAKIVDNFLKPGGSFYIVELHPFTNILSYDLKLEYKYFLKGPYIDDSDGTYTDWKNAKVKGFTYECSNTMGDVIKSNINEGMKK